MVGLIRSVGYVMLLNENLEDLLINGKLLGKKLPFPGMGMDKKMQFIKRSSEYFLFL